MRKIDLKSEYNTDDDNILRDLYNPCLKEAMKYDRAVGYFRANIYRELGEDLLDFVIKGGKVRIVTSPDITKTDEEAARDGYALRNKRTDFEKETNLLHIMKIMAVNPKEEDCLDMLRLLIEKGSLDLYIAIREGGIYHRKMGLFCDEYGNKVVFSGSGNETSNALFSLEDWGNDEDFDVFRSWGNEFESRKAAIKEKHLEILLNGGNNRTKVRPINEVERSYLDSFRSHKTFEDCRKGARERTASLNPPPRIKSISLYEYQKSAIEAWKNAGNIGMLSMATGTGKTYTALFAIERLLVQGNPILVLVPSNLLLDQWKDAITEIYPDVPVLMAGGKYSWRNRKNKRMFISRIRLPRIILSTMDTAVSTDFLEFFSQAQNPVLIADEVHRLGSEVHREILTLSFSAKLGLSATPERLFDEKGSQILETSFGGTPVFTLDIGQSVKLKEGDPKDVPILGYFLSPYDYYFYPVELTKKEQTEWNRITNEIKQTVAIIRSKEGESGLRANTRLNLLLIERARLIKKAENKVAIINKIVEEKYPSNGKWIVYCEDENQLDLVAGSLRNNNQAIVILKYHSKMENEKRHKTLEYFKENPSIIVSIRCLDEGVDIPSADGAIILASSSNPRQYIQRRGRVLRKAIDKKSATIIDVLVLPVSDEDKIPFSIIKGELGRGWDFAKNARNRDITHQLWKLCVEYGVNPNIDPQLGMEE